MDDKKFSKKFLVHDMTLGPTKVKYDAIYALDVLEHISKKKEKIFIKNIISSMKANGALILGCPSIESQKYTNSKEQGHLNCKSGQEFKSLLESFFHNVFLFSMNDEVLHTGFEKCLIICF